MTKSELIAALAARYSQLTARDTDYAVKTVLDAMTQALAEGQRIEIRGFGSFTVNERFEKVGLLDDRRTFVLVSSGNARKGHEPDFLTPYLSAILSIVGIRSVEFAYLGAMVRGEEAVSQAVAQAHRQLSEAISSGL